MRVVLTPVILVTTLSIMSLPTHAATGVTSDVTNSGTSSWQSADAHETWTRGTVVRVSLKRSKLTIEHEPITNLEMMAMTMPFTVSDPTLLEGLAAGDSIEFVADKNGNELIIRNLRRPKS